jgi:hypothetical protein
MFNKLKVLWTIFLICFITISGTALAFAIAVNSYYTILLVIGIACGFDFFVLMHGEKSRPHIRLAILTCDGKGYWLKHQFGDLDEARACGELISRTPGIGFYIAEQ